MKKEDMIMTIYHQMRFPSKASTKRSRRGNEPDTSKWPWNNRPSSRHVLKVTFQNGGVFGETCQRCGSHYNTRADATAPVYCFPSKAWLAAHPDDDGLLGERRTPFG
jgi:hypothetical protein